MLSSGHYTTELSGTSPSQRGFSKDSARQMCSFTGKEKARLLGSPWHIPDDERP